MNFEHTYKGQSGVHNDPSRTGMSFAPDLSRDAVWFDGRLAHGVAFREAISALHDVVVSDLRFKPKDRVAYKAWLAEQEQQDALEVMGQVRTVRAQAEQLKKELAEVRRSVASKMGPFWTAQRRYFDYLYQRDREAWFVLDPVITVHPDRLFFECFSVDESSYGCLAADYSEFGDVGEFRCGTTNVDYSQGLYDGFQKIRSYRTTSLTVDPTGFEVQTGSDPSHREVKIDVPDTWVRGFLQVSSAMTLPATELTLHPLDVFNLCRTLRRRKEDTGPRSLRFQLTPGEPARILVEPFGHTIVCARSPFTGPEATEVRVWGRRRLHILERLIPVARSFRVRLLGYGLPSFWIADLGSMSFTLGLSGWTKNDWSRAGNFDLMAPRAEVDGLTRDRVFAALKASWLATPDALASQLGLDRATVLGALSLWTQAGRAIFDLDKGVYRCRELTRDPLPLEQLRFANEREEAATRTVDRGGVRVDDQRLAADGTLVLRGTITGTRPMSPTLQVDADERIRTGTCDCNFFQQNKLRKGPCEHMLALRMQAARAVRDATRRRA